MKESEDFFMERLFCFALRENVEQRRKTECGTGSETRGKGGIKQDAEHGKGLGK